MHPDKELPAISEFFDGSPVPSFAIDMDHVITHWNKACAFITGTPAAQMIGTRNHWKPFYPSERPVLADLIVDGAFDARLGDYYQDKFRRSSLIPGAVEAEDFFPGLGDGGRWMYFSAAPLHDRNGHVVGAIEIMQDVSIRTRAEAALKKVHQHLEQQVTERTAQLEQDIRQREETEAELLRRNAELTEVNERLSRAQQQLIQADKLASIGQLAAGVAHEINNPIGYIFSNFGTLGTYLESLMEMLRAYESAEPTTPPATRAALRALRERIELDYLKEDIPVMMRESMEGIVRVRKIVQDLKDFSRVDNFQEWQWANLHQGIDSTLNIVNNEVKYKADIVRKYGELPEVECLASQLNQVIMNLVVNAAQAMDQADQGRGTIVIETGCDKAAGAVWIEVADNGKGISVEHQARIFDPFFTTKPVGMGTGLGLSLAYGIISAHRGTIVVDSVPGQGATFRITLPVQQTNAPHGR